MDQYWHIQSPVNANLYKSLDITLNGPILACSSPVNANLRKSLDITLNGPILAYSKSRQCKSLQIS
uniref:Uncharacterized protein n=1 Tax=viral metagenome TaxID=1070528 RepID=A0A6C0C894_9ZZZZ